MRNVETSRTIQVPDDVEATLEGRVVTVEGSRGTLSRNFQHAPIQIALTGKTFRVWAEWPRKKESSLVGTVHSHIQNMIKGVQKGFTCKLKIVFSHFPISVKVKERTVLIENFTGERSPRKARIMGNSRVKVLAEDVVVEDINLENLSQTAANIEQATKVKRKDPRVFLDGIYVYERYEGME